MNNTQTIWISLDTPNLHLCSKTQDVIWCKSIEDAKHTVQEYEIETINSRFVKESEVIIRPIVKIIVEDFETYEQINLWLSETNRQYLLDKVELISKEMSSGNVNSEMVRYILTTVEHGLLKYFSRKDKQSFNTFWSTDMKDVILFNTEIEAEEQERQIKIYDKMNVSVRKITINATINYIY